MRRFFKCSNAFSSLSFAAGPQGNTVTLIVMVAFGIRRIVPSDFQVSIGKGAAAVVSRSRGKVRARTQFREHWQGVA